MTLYCYYFKPDGTIERESIRCRKNKECYAFKVGPLDTMDYLYFNDVGKIKNTESHNTNHIGCRMYLTEKIEITEEMKKFAEYRAKKIKELWDIQKQFEGEIRDAKIALEDNIPH